MERIRVFNDPLTAQVNADGAYSGKFEARGVISGGRDQTQRSQVAGKPRHAIKPEERVTSKLLFSSPAPRESSFPEETQAVDETHVLDILDDVNTHSQMHSQETPLGKAMGGKSILPLHEPSHETEINGGAGFNRLLRDPTEEEELEDLQVRDLMVGQMLEQGEPERMTATQKMKKTDELFGHVSSEVVVGQARNADAVLSGANEAKDTDTLLKKLDDLHIDETAAARHGVDAVVQVDGREEDVAPVASMPDDVIVSDIGGFNFDEYIQREGQTTGGGLFD